MILRQNFFFWKEATEKQNYGLVNSIKSEPPEVSIGHGKLDPMKTFQPTKRVIYGDRVNREDDLALIQLKQNFELFEPVKIYSQNEISTSMTSFLTGYVFGRNINDGEFRYVQMNQITKPDKIQNLAKNLFEKQFDSSSLKFMKKAGTQTKLRLGKRKFKGENFLSGGAVLVPVKDKFELVGVYAGRRNDPDFHISGAMVKRPKIHFYVNVLSKKHRDWIRETIEQYSSIDDCDEEGTTPEMAFIDSSLL